MHVCVSMQLFKVFHTQMHLPRRRPAATVMYTINVHIKLVNLAWNQRETAKGRVRKLATLQREEERIEEGGEVEGDQM